MILKCNSVLYLLQFYSHHCIAALVRLILWFCKWCFGKQDDLLKWSKQGICVCAKITFHTHLGNASVFFRSIIDFSIIPITQTMISRPSLLHHFYWSKIIPVSENNMVPCKTPQRQCLHHSSWFANGISVGGGGGERSVNDDDGGFTTTVDSQTATQSEKEEPPLYWAWFPRPAQCLPYYGNSTCLVPAATQRDRQQAFYGTF